MRTTLRTVLVGVVVSALAGLGLTGPGSAAADTAPVAPLPATVSADPLPTWQVTGVVWSQVVVGNTVYATGNFTKARPPGMWQGGPTEITVGHLIAYDITTGARVASFNHLLNAQGMTVTASPDGSRVYVGGDFTTVDGIARSHIAAFDTGTGALSQAFAPAINGQVRSVAATNTTVYAGGAFESAEGVARNRLASFAATNGAMSRTWAPTAPDGYVWSMVVAPGGSKVVIGGQFDTLNGVAVHGMGAVDAVTGASMAWAANTVIKDSINGAITSLRTDGTSVYGSGYAFGAGSSFEGTFSANPVTGAINWLNDCHGDTYDVLPLGKVVYSVSHAHDCSWIGAFPDTSPRVRWQHALATTNYATGTNKGPDNYGWNFNGQPASTLLQWYPDLGIGTFTGQYQAAWSLAGNATYVVLGGEFPTVNGGEQQGLTRFAVTSAAPNKRGPQYTTVPARPTPATTATATTPGAVQVSFGTAWDMDNQRLTYEVIRDGQSVVYTTTADTNFWTLPNLSFTDTGLAAGSHSYQVRIKDPFNNTLLSPVSNTVTVLAGNQPPVAAFTSTAANLVASFDGSGSSDPDGTIASYGWVFGDATTGTGAKPSHTYAAAGTYSVKLTVTDNLGASSSVTKAVTVTSGPFAKDTFARTVANGWGAADVGGSWSVSGGSAHLSVANGWGKLATPAPGTGVTALLSGVSSLNTDLQLQFAMDKLPTGGGQFFWVIGRGVPSDGYRAKVWVSSSGTMVLYLSKYVGGAETELVSSVVPGVTYVPGDAYQLRLQVLGAGPTTLQAKAWKLGTSEPAAWTVTGTDSTTSLQSAGAIGFQTYLSAAATNAPLTISVGQLFARNP